MESINHTIKDPLGIHARPAGMLVRLAMNFNSELSIARESGESYSLKKIFTIMSLGLKYGEKLTISAKGDDEKEAIQALSQYLSNNL